MELNNSHTDMVEKFKQQVQQKTTDAYMLTIARDGESPVRSIYFYDNAIDASSGYEAYSDWGFSKNFLTVTLYEPTGKVHEKILSRPMGGECVFIREDYTKLSKIYADIKDGMDQDRYNHLVLESAKLLSKDNQRFDPKRFFVDTGYTGDTKSDK
jgi:exopolysaccharide biosynthesis predicted pyruvyltransferase EpsI